MQSKAIFTDHFLRTPNHETVQLCRRKRNLYLIFDNTIRSRCGQLLREIYITSARDEFLFDPQEKTKWLAVYFLIMNVLNVASLLIDEKESVHTLEYLTPSRSRGRKFSSQLSATENVLCSLSDFYRFSISPLYSRDDALPTKYFNVKYDAMCSRTRWDSLLYLFFSPPVWLTIFAHRSHRRCLITESMMKTNCCVYRNVLRLRRELPSCWCAQNVVKNSGGVKIYYTNTSETQAYDHILRPLDLLLMCIKIKKRSMIFRAALPCAYSKRNSVSSYMVHPWISNFNKKYFSRLHFVHLRCDSVSGWITKENSVFWYIFAFFFPWIYTVFWFRLLLLRFESIEFRFSAGDACW